MTVTGSASGEIDPGTGISIQHQATATFDACKNSQGLEVSGQVTLESQMQLQRGDGGGPQGEHTATYQGELNWVDEDGESGTCVIDLHVHANFTERTRTVEGTVCDEEVSNTRTWSFNWTWPTSSLSSAEATAVAHGVADETFPALAESIPSGGGDAGVSSEPFTFEREFEHTRECQEGGSVTVTGNASGEIDPMGDGITTQHQATATFDACKNSEGVEVSGQVTIEGQMQLQRGENGGVEGEHTGTIQGELNWVNEDGESGTCVIDLHVHTNFTEKTRTVEGTVCDEEVNNTRTWSFNWTWPGGQ